MLILGWLLAYWFFWMLVGCFVMGMRFPDFFDEFAVECDRPIDDKLALLWNYVTYLTNWPRNYLLRQRFEEDDDDDDDDDATFQN